jgi:5'-phosphate synthase pdxT subunit
MGRARIGVLALQGAFREHLEMLAGLDAEGREVRRPEEMRGLDGLIIPGGESTTIGKLAAEWGLLPPIAELAANGTAVWGTCAGMILLAKDIGREQPLVGVMDIVVARNAFGRQVDSFEVDLPVPALDGDGSPFRAVFIRAPLIERVGPGCEVLARLEDGTVVAARQGNLLVTAFHPELTDDTRFHRYFLDMAALP